MNTAMLSFPLSRSLMSVGSVFRSYVRRQNVSAPKKTGNCILEESLIFFDDVRKEEKICSH